MLLRCHIFELQYHQTVFLYIKKNYNMLSHYLFVLCVLNAKFTPFLFQNCQNHGIINSYHGFGEPVLGFVFALFLFNRRARCVIQ